MYFSTGRKFSQFHDISQLLSCNYPSNSGDTYQLYFNSIDNIFSNRVDEIQSTEVITTNISDHYPIFSTELRPSLAENVLSINYIVFSNENLFNFKNSLQYTNWEPILNNHDANESYELFQSTFLFRLKIYILKQNINHGLPQEY